MIRVVCEYCQTVYNIPETKLSRAVSQATCKVCQNKIVITREDVAGDDNVTTRQPVVTPTATAASAPIGTPEDFGNPETELSNSWREAIVDNRQTNQILKNIGVRVPHEAATASGPRVAEPKSKPPEVERTGELDPEESTVAAKRDLADPVAKPVRSAVIRPAVPAPVPESVAPAAGNDRGASAIASVLAGLACAVAAAGLLRGHGWAAGLSGLAAFAAVTFAAGASLSNALLRRRGAIGILASIFGGLVVAVAALAIVIALNLEQFRGLLAARPELAPLVQHLR